MSERIQLKDPGSELVMVVKSVKPETVEKNEYFLFDSGQKELLVPQSSVNAQLTRMDVLSVNNLVGRGVKFSRSLKMSRASKPYWNVDLATPEELKAVGSASAAVPATGNPAGAAGAPSSPKSYADIYMKATDFIIEKIVPKYRAAKLEPTANDVHAMVSTLFIPKSKES